MVLPDYRGENAVHIAFSPQLNKDAVANLLLQNIKLCGMTFIQIFHCRHISVDIFIDSSLCAGENFVVADTFTIAFVNDVFFYEKEMFIF